MKFPGLSLSRVVLSLFAGGKKSSSKVQGLVGVQFIGANVAPAAPTSPTIRPLPLPLPGSPPLVSVMRTMCSPNPRGIPNLAQFRTKQMTLAKSTNLEQITSFEINQAACPSPVLRQTEVRLLRTARMMQVCQGGLPPESPKSYTLRRGGFSDSLRLHAKHLEMASSVKVLTADLLNLCAGAPGDSLFGHAAWKVSHIQDVLSEGRKLDKTTIEKIRHLSMERCGFPPRQATASVLANLASTSQLSPGRYIPKEIKGQVADEVYEALRRAQPSQLVQPDAKEKPFLLTLPSLTEVEKIVREVFDELVPAQT